MPLRFVDMSTTDTSSLGLNARIDTVPTAVVMRDGREVDRIVGYWGPTNFFIVLSHILAGWSSRRATRASAGPSAPALALLPPAADPV